MDKHSATGGLAMTYHVIYEKGRKTWSAYAPDLPGYAAVADSLDELRGLVREGIPFHIEGLRRSGEPVPKPNTVIDSVEVA